MITMTISKNGFCFSVQKLDMNPLKQPTKNLAWRGVLNLCITTTSFSLSYKNGRRFIAISTYYLHKQLIKKNNV